MSDVNITVTHSDVGLTVTRQDVEFPITVNVVQTVDGGSGITDGDKGDITVSGSGATWEINARAVTPTEFFEVGHEKLIGRHGAGDGDAQEIGVGEGIGFDGGSIVVTDVDSEKVNTTQTDESTTSRTLSDADHGKVLRFTNGSAVGVTVPNTLRSDFTCAVIQFGTGQITFTGSSANIRNRQSHSKTAGQYAVVSLVKVDSGEFVLMGDTAS